MYQQYVELMSEKLSIFQIYLGEKICKLIRRKEFFIRNTKYVEKFTWMFKKIALIIRNKVFKYEFKRKLIRNEGVRLY